MIFITNVKYSNNPKKIVNLFLVIDIEILENDIGKATDQLQENLAPGPDGILVIFLKKTKMKIARLLILIRQSIDKNKTANIHKMAYVSLIHRV